MDDGEVGHRWAPIADVTLADRAAASTELPPLAQLWKDIRNEFDPIQVHDFNERIQRQWAIETGVIERVYTLDRGTTQLLIERGIRASLIASDATDQSPELVAGMIQDHAEAVAWLFDAVTSKRPLSTSLIKQLHQLMTRKQQFATGFDQFGNRIDIPLRHGAFKIRPNNPRRPDGKVHQYCPPEQVDSEMDRLIEMHGEHDEEGLSADVSAAWLHHRFVQIHPFQDGNGRVARAIASLVLIRAGWFPLVVTRDDRDGYIEALERADGGDLARFVQQIARFQRKQFIGAAGIAAGVGDGETDLKQMLREIRAKPSRSRPTRHHMELIQETAARLVAFCRSRFEYVAEELNADSGGAVPTRARCDFGDEGDPERRRWNRSQVMSTAQILGYSANPGAYHDWVRLRMETEAGSAEMLASFHVIGTKFRGLLGASLCFYRRQQDEHGESQVIELEPASNDVFQFNYVEPPRSVEARFRRWLEHSMVIGLGHWHHSE